jgi:hypothetical protein
MRSSKNKKTPQSATHQLYQLNKLGHFTKTSSKKSINSINKLKDKDWPVPEGTNRLLKNISPAAPLSGPHTPLTTRNREADLMDNTTTVT